jgi:hypothetical protein
VLVTRKNKKKRVRKKGDDGDSRNLPPDLIVAAVE